jgi:hypothetical protein
VKSSHQLQNRANQHYSICRCINVYNFLNVLLQIANKYASGSILCIVAAECDRGQATEVKNDPIGYARTVSSATVERQSTIGSTGLSIAPAKCYMGVSPPKIVNFAVC